jgi:hypothetical protein
MLTLWDAKQTAFCDRIARREFLKVGALTVGGLTLADLCRLQAQGSARRSAKKVIMVWLNGGPSHLETYDLKPDAPLEVRGEFRPIQTTVPGFEMSECLPLQARMAERLAVVRSLVFANPNHDRSLNFSGFPDQQKRPAFGSLVSRLRSQESDRLHYVSMVSRHPEQPYLEEPLYAGAEHKPFRIDDDGTVQDLELPPGLTVEQLTDRKQLMMAFDRLRRDVDVKGEFKALDRFHRQALEIVTSPGVRAAFDLSQEPAAVRERYGKLETHPYSRTILTWIPEKLLLARRLVEAGVSVVTVSVGQWDHHEDIFRTLRWQLARLDKALCALLTDLHERGLEEEVAVVVWGEMGRTPRINKDAGRDHWADSGYVLFAGGGLRMGQAIGATNAYGEQPRTRPVGTQNVLATLYHLLGIDPALTVPDFQGRPRNLVDERDLISELL